MIPVNLSCEDQGIRFTLISALAAQQKGYYLYSVDDPEGNLDGGEIHPAFTDTVVERNTSRTDTELYYDTVNHRHVLFTRTEYDQLTDAADRDVTLGLSCLKLWKSSSTDLVPLIRQYNVTENGVAVPENSNALYHDRDEIPEGMKVLNPARSLDIPAGESVTLNNIGWIDGELHAQFRFPSGELRSGALCRSTADDDDSDGFSVQSYESHTLRWEDDTYVWLEFITDCRPEELDRVSLTIDFSHYANVIDGQWTVRLPLSSILAESAGESAAEPTAEPTPEPTPEPTAEPAAEPAAKEPEASRTEDAGAEAVIASYQDTGRPHALWQILCGWAGGDVAEILEWCLPEWKANTTNPQQVIENIILARGTPKSFQLNRFDSSDDDSVEKVLLAVELEPAEGSGSKYVNVNAAFRKDAQNVFRLDPSALVITEREKPGTNSKMISLSEESILHANLEAYYPEVCEKLIPVNLSCEKQGIRVEIISALLREQEGWFLYSIEDLEGRYTGNELFSGLTDNVDIPVSGGGAQLYVSASGHKVIRMLYSVYRDPVGTSDRVINMNVTDLHVEQNVSVDLSPIIAQYAETTEGIASPSVTKTYWRNRNYNFDVQNMNILDPSEGPDLSLSRDGVLSGIGWIDGKLHVQFSGPKDSVINCTFNDKSVKTGDKDIHYYLGEMRWTDKDARKERVERVLEWQPEDPDQTHLEADFSIAVAAIEDTWVIPVSLLSILEGAGE